MQFENRCIARACRAVFGAVMGVCLILGATANSRAADDSSMMGPVTHQTLKNGLQVLIAPSTSSDLVTVDVWVGAGTRRETAENNGVAHFIEHLLFKGTPTRKPGDIDAAIEDLGGTLDAATSYDWAHFYVTVGASDAASALNIVADAVRNAELRQDDMDQERPVILNEMARNDADPLERLKTMASAKLFGDHPYGRPIMGTQQNVMNMKRETLLDFYRTYYVPANVTLVLSGNLTPDEGMAMANKAFGDWAVKPLPNDKLLTPAPMSQIVMQEINEPVSNGYITIAFNAPSVKDIPDAYVMDVLLTLLGQGGNDRLEADLLYKQKLVTAIEADYLTQHDPGMLTISATFPPENRDQVIAGILAEVQNLRDNLVSDDDLAAAKRALLSGYLFDVQTTSGRADALGFYNTIDTYRYDTNYISNFEGITAQQLKDVADKYLNTSAYAEVTLMPRPNPVTASVNSTSNILSASVH